MKILTPKYYDDFHCLASDCPDSCCKQWDVLVDPDSEAKYRSFLALWGARLRSVLTKDADGDTVFAMTQGRCPMWRQDGLCTIQAALDETALCAVCREFPRIRHDYGDFVELGLELSCPEAARLILSAPRAELTAREVPGGETPEYDAEAMELLLASRQVALAFLEQTDLPVGQTLAVLLLYGYSVQDALDGGTLLPLDVESALRTARELAAPGSLKEILAFYSGLEILTDAWRERLGAQPVSGAWAEPLRAMARYGVGRYWLQAVSDYELASRVKLVVLSCLLVNALGGDLRETAQLYGKEIENDPDNIEAILDAAYTAPALTDRSILGLLLK